MSRSCIFNPSCSLCRKIVVMKDACRVVECGGRAIRAITVIRYAPSGSLHLIVISWLAALEFCKAGRLDVIQKKAQCSRQG